jgi:hypothetical protein
MRKHCRESSRNFPGRAAKRRAGPALVVARTGRAGPGGRRAGPKNFGPFSALNNNQPLLFPPSPPPTHQQHLKAFKLQLLDCKTGIVIYRVSRYFFTVFIVGKNFSIAQH